MDKSCKKLFYTPSEIAKTLQLNVMTIYEYIREKRLVAIRFGRNYRIEKKDFDRFIRAHKTK